MTLLLRYRLKLTIWRALRRIQGGKSPLLWAATSTYQKERGLLPGSKKEAPSVDAYLSSQSKGFNNSNLNEDVNKQSVETTEDMNFSQDNSRMTHKQLAK